MEKQKTSETYRYIRYLGGGTFGKVYLIQSNLDQRLYASKMIPMTQNDSAKIKNEVKILKKLDNPFIIHFKEFFYTKTPPSFYIITEYVDGGDLASYIAHLKSPPPKNLFLDWMIQLCVGISYIHSKKIIHRDLKPNNIFLTKSLMIKIGDFGISRKLNFTWEKASTFTGTMQYISPEIIESKPYSFKSDIFSLGILLYELVSLKNPFDASNEIAITMKIKECRVPPLPTSVPREIREVIYMMLQKNPDKRPTADEVLNMNFIKERMVALLRENKYKENESIMYIKKYQEKIRNRHKGMFYKKANSSEVDSNENNHNSTERHLVEPNIIIKKTKSTNDKIPMIRLTQKTNNDPNEKVFQYKGLEASPKMVKIPKEEIIHKHITNSEKDEKEQEEQYDHQRFFLLISQISQNKCQNEQQPDTNNEFSIHNIEEDNNEVINNTNDINNFITDSMLGDHLIKEIMEKSIGAPLFESICKIVQEKKDIIKIKQSVLKEMIDQKCNKSQIDLTMGKINEIIEYNKKNKI